MVFYHVGILHGDGGGRAQLDILRLELCQVLCLHEPGKGVLSAVGLACFSVSVVCLRFRSDTFSVTHLEL